MQNGSDMWIVDPVPDELALYGLSRKYGVHTAIFNRSYVMDHSCRPCFKK